MYYGEKRVKNPIRWGMVGGGRGSQIGYIHRSAALRDFNFQLVAGAFDIDPARGKDFGEQLHVAADRCYPDYKTMFVEEAKRPDGVQAVSIATPNGMHYEVCKAALEAGLHVVCEKPLCFTSEQADELVKLAEEKHRVVGVTYGYSGHQLIQQARQMIKNGDLGEIRVINMSFAFGGYNFKIEDKVPSAKWRFDPSKAGPSFALGDVGTHPLFIIEAMIPDMKIDNLMCTKRSFVEGRERGAGYLTDEARVEDRIGCGHAEGLFEAWSNLYARFAVAMADADKGVYGDFWYPDVKAGAQGIKWIEKCVESADKGSAWVDYE